MSLPLKPLLFGAHAISIDPVIQIATSNAGGVHVKSSYGFCGNPTGSLTFSSCQLLVIGIATSILFDALLHFLTNDGQSFSLIENVNGFSLILNIVGRIVGLTFQLTETSAFPFGQSLQKRTSLAHWNLNANYPKSST